MRRNESCFFAFGDEKAGVTVDATLLGADVCLWPVGVVVDTGILLWVEQISILIIVYS